MDNDSKEIKVGSLIEIIDLSGKPTYDIVCRIFGFYETNPLYYYCCLKPNKANDSHLKKIKLIQ